MQSEQKKPKELTDLEVHEVSVVDRPAIRRPFFVVKSLSKPESLESDMARKTKAKDAEVTEVESTTGENTEVEKSESVEEQPVLESVAKADDAMEPEPGRDDESEEVPMDSVPQDNVQKAMPILTAIAQERIGLVAEKLQALSLGLGSMTKPEAWSALSQLSSACYDMEKDIISVSKAIEAPEAKIKYQSEEKCACSKQQVDALKSLVEKSRGSMDGDLLSVLDAITKSDETPTQKQESEMTIEQVEAVVAKALEPLLAKLEKAGQAPVAKAEEAKPEVVVEKSESKVESILESIQKSLTEMNQRMDNLEATPSSVVDATSTVKKSDGSLFKGII